MELTSEVIYGFSNLLLSERYDDPVATPQFHKDLWELCCDPHPQVAIAAPRGHAKSTAVTHAYVLASILFGQADFVVIISDTERQAIKFLGDIKMELYENDKLRKLFTVGKFLTDAEREVEVELGNEKRKVMIMVRGASGGSGSVRGFKWRGKRPNLIVCDDMENDEAVANEERRAKFRQWFTGALIPTMSKNGRIRVVGTILHFDSLLERFMPQASGESVTHTVTEGLKTYSTEEDPDWLAVKYRAHTDFTDFSDILWPEMFDEERLKRLRRSYILQGFPEGYSQEYLNYPMDEESAFFKRSDMLPMEEEDFKKPKTYYAAIDPAISTEDSRAFTAIVVGGMDEDGYLHIEHVIRERLDSMEIVDHMLALQVRFKLDKFAIEKGAIEKSIGPHLDLEMLNSGIFINKWVRTPTHDKKYRARSIQARMRQGAVKFDKEAEWYLNLEDEMLKFDKGPYKDQVDAMAWLGLMLTDMVPSRTQAEIDEDEWEREFNETYGDDPVMNGRSAITGY